MKPSFKIPIWNLKRALRPSHVWKLITLVLTALVIGCTGPAGRDGAPSTRIAFGSCINTNTHPMLDRVLRTDFDLFILLGDNIYADTTNVVVMQRKYNALKSSPFFRGLSRKSPVLATWDDHDYGANDAGAEYPMKVESQRLFLDFMDEPADSPRRQRQGVYDARVFGPPGRRVQVILLDVRYFRSLLSTGVNNVVPSGGKYIPNPDPNATMLGEAQWSWLEGQLQVPAEVRVIATGIQFISEFSGGEAWANLPREKQRMLDLLAKTKASGVIFISGDRHWAELSQLDRPGDYPLYDLTSSALTQNHPRGTPTPNRYRADPRTYHDANFGLIRIDWKTGSPAVTLQLLDVNGRVRIEKKVALE
jgi:alkaline phosphatase D